MTKEDIENKLKFTKITSNTLYHFKYDGVDYVMLVSQDDDYNDFISVFKGRRRGHLEELETVYTAGYDLLKYKYHRTTLSSIDKEYFIEHLPHQLREVIETGKPIELTKSKIIDLLSEHKDYYITLGGFTGGAAWLDERITGYFISPEIWSQLKDEVVVFEATCNGPKYKLKEN